MKFEKIGIILRPNIDSDKKRAVNTFLSYMREKYNVTIYDSRGTEGYYIVEGSSKRPISQQDLIISLGGDGTLLHAAPACVYHNIPIYGINVGNLGFLTDTTLNLSGESDSFRYIDEIIEGDCEIEERILFTYDIPVLEGEVALPSEMVLNDVVFRSKQSKMMEYKLRLDSRTVLEGRADGLIVSTPTGSTAYSLSAGGPIVHPQADVCIITPICPHSFTNKPIVIPADTNIMVYVKNGSTITIDGRKEKEINSYEAVSITRKNSPYKLNMVHKPNHNYYELLSTKLAWGR